ncbi:hypothetical protein HDU76_004150 [Blyttiomyces sp. JEL0837]|nr:hypothetical protein HDU76_004150 [Blyttiomyces sp. JEL0837]
MEGYYSSGYSSNGYNYNYNYNINFNYRYNDGSYFNQPLPPPAPHYQQYPPYIANNFGYHQMDYGPLAPMNNRFGPVRSRSRSPPPFRNNEYYDHRHRYGPPPLPHRQHSQELDHSTGFHPSHRDENFANEGYSRQRGNRWGGMVDRERLQYDRNRGTSGGESNNLDRGFESGDENWRVSRRNAAPIVVVEDEEDVRTTVREPFISEIHEIAVEDVSVSDNVNDSTAGNQNLNVVHQKENDDVVSRDSEVSLGHGEGKVGIGKEDLLKSMEMELACSICHDLMCIITWSREGTPTCPQCRTPMDKNPIKHINSQELIEIILTHKKLSPEEITDRNERSEKWKSLQNQDLQLQQQRVANGSPQASRPVVTVENATALNNRNRNRSLQASILDTLVSSWDDQEDEPRPRDTASILNRLVSRDVQEGGARQRDHVGSLQRVGTLTGRVGDGNNIQSGQNVGDDDITSRTIATSNNNIGSGGTRIPGGPNSWAAVDEILGVTNQNSNVARRYDGGVGGGIGGGGGGSAAVRAQVAEETVFSIENEESVDGLDGRDAVGSRDDDLMVEIVGFSDNGNYVDYGDYGDYGNDVEANYDDSTAPSPYFPSASAVERQFLEHGYNRDGGENFVEYFYTQQETGQTETHIEGGDNSRGSSDNGYYYYENNRVYYIPTLPPPLYPPSQRMNDPPPPPINNNRHGSSVPGQPSVVPLGHFPRSRSRSPPPPIRTNDEYEEYRLRNGPPPLPYRYNSIDRGHRTEFHPYYRRDDNNIRSEGSRSSRQRESPRWSSMTAQERLEYVDRNWRNLVPPVRDRSNNNVVNRSFVNGDENSGLSRRNRAPVVVVVENEEYVRTTVEVPEPVMMEIGEVAVEDVVVGGGAVEDHVDVEDSNGTSTSGNQNLQLQVENENQKENDEVVSRDVDVSLGYGESKLGLGEVDLLKSIEMELACSICHDLMVAPHMISPCDPTPNINSQKLIEIIITHKKLSLDEITDRNEKLRKWNSLKDQGLHLQLQRQQQERIDDPPSRRRVLTVVNDENVRTLNNRNPGLRPVGHGNVVSLNFEQGGERPVRHDHAGLLQRFNRLGNRFSDMMDERIRAGDIVGATAQNVGGGGVVVGSNTTTATTATTTTANTDHNNNNGNGGTTGAPVGREYQSAWASGLMNLFSLRNLVGNNARRDVGGVGGAGSGGSGSAVVQAPVVEETVDSNESEESVDGSDGLDGMDDGGGVRGGRDDGGSNHSVLESTFLEFSGDDEGHDNYDDGEDREDDNGTAPSPVLPLAPPAMEQSVEG